MKIYIAVKAGSGEEVSRILGDDHLPLEATMSLNPNVIKRFLLGRELEEEDSVGGGQSSALSPWTLLVMETEAECSLVFDMTSI